MEETHACTLKELVGICAEAYTAPEIVRMERTMACTLQYRFRSATVWHFCCQYWELLGVVTGDPESRRAGADAYNVYRSRIAGVREAGSLLGWVEDAKELSHVRS